MGKRINSYDILYNTGNTGLYEKNQNIQQYLELTNHLRAMGKWMNSYVISYYTYNTRLNKKNKSTQITTLNINESPQIHPRMDEQL